MDYTEGFERLVKDQDSSAVFSKNMRRDQEELPLAPQGMRVLWDTLYGYHGWKLQKNYYFDYYRIIDENHRKRAWGTGNEVLAMLETYAH